jgi:hypothetical protein
VSELQLLLQKEMLMIANQDEDVNDICNDLHKNETYNGA